MQSVNLSASSFYVPNNSSTMYLNYGAAVSEVFCFHMHISNLHGIISSLKAIFYVQYLNCHMCHITEVTESNDYI
jgi:hypothetical protein